MKKIKTALISVSDKENQNIFISGMNNEKEQIIKWEISKLQ